MSICVCVCVRTHICISRVFDQNDVSLLYIMREIHHSGQEPSICVCETDTGKKIKRKTQKGIERFRRKEGERERG